MVGHGFKNLTREKRLIYLLVKINTVQEKVEKEEFSIYSFVQQIFSNTCWPKNRDSKGFVCVLRKKVTSKHYIFITISDWQALNPVPILTPLSF